MTLSVKLIPLFGLVPIMVGAHPTSDSAKAPVVVAAQNVITQQISYGDLDLASTAGERMLKRRVGSAVGRLCLEATGAFEGTYNHAAAVNCRHGAWSEARPQIAAAVQRARGVAATGRAIPAAVISIAVRK